MNTRAIVCSTLNRLGPRYLPFADVASEQVPLSRLLRLSLFQVTVGMALVLLVGTLNRVMIVESGVPAGLVAVMIALPLVFAPFRAIIGFKPDIHKSALGWRRVPYVWKGTLLQFGGFAIMPLALFVLSGYGEASDAPLWIGYGSAALAFLLVGAGVHMVQTVGLALATDLVPVEDQPKVVGLMYVMLLVGMILSVIVFGVLLVNYTPGRLIQVVQGAAVVTIALNLAALWKQEASDRTRAQDMTPLPEFREAWAMFIAGRTSIRLLVAIALGTAGFGMAEVLLEPYGGQVLGLSVATTTRLTAVLAAGGLLGFALASRVLLRGADPTGVAWWWALAGVPGLVLITAPAPLDLSILVVAGTLIAGFGAGLFWHGTLAATMRAAPRGQVGLALGTWGAVQASAAGLAIALGGLIRDGILAVPGVSEFGPSIAYAPVYALEIICLAAAVLVMSGLRRKTIIRPEKASAHV